MKPKATSGIRSQVEPDVMEKFRQYAEEQGRSVSSQVRWMVREAVRKWEAETAQKTGSPV